MMHMQRRSELGEVELRRFRRKIYLKIVEMWIGGRREARSAHTRATTKGSEDLTRWRSARDNGAAGSGSPPSLSTTA